ncbi:hypothetical protein DOTSEDRAFT_26848 [Dothistroma septosporum NZE10]|uniref:Uncharacterized protein n=1 Tax=Dothistroma septosporum (strain NZE10 / CBS 128990) TaxID=675120 RepID=N1PKB7_DOTSN|nr:hypothetical protein DOTSEDRAFT_26848 [Dothistroma septosporum NZE10]
MPPKTKPADALEAQEPDKQDRDSAIDGKDEQTNNDYGKVPRTSSRKTKPTEKIRKPEKPKEPDAGDTHGVDDGTGGQEKGFKGKGRAKGDGSQQDPIALGENDGQPGSSKASVSAPKTKISKAGRTPQQSGNVEHGKQRNKRKRGTAPGTDDDEQAGSLAVPPTSNKKVRQTGEASGHSDEAQQSALGLNRKRNGSSEIEALPDTSSPGESAKQSADGNDGDEESDESGESDEDHDTDLGGTEHVPSASKEDDEDPDEVA